MNIMLFLFTQSARTLVTDEEGTTLELLTVPDYSDKIPTLSPVHAGIVTLNPKLACFYPEHPYQHTAPYCGLKNLSN
jgi:hypothetical protein